MDKIDPNASAFPWKGCGAGLTIRAEFAKMAMAGMLSHNGQLSLEDLILQSVEYADALIAQLNREGKK